MSERSQQDRGSEEPERSGGVRTDQPSHPMTGKTWAMLIALAVLIILLIIFIAQNTDPVKVSFLGWTWHPALAALLVLAVLVGILVALFTRALWAVRAHRRARRMRRAHRDADED